MTLLSRSVDRGLHLLARTAHVLPITDPARYGLSLTRDVPYRDTGERAHLLDVYRPKHAGLRPAVLYVHGGGFAMLSKETHRVMAMCYARCGYVVFNINYRLGRRNPYPVPLQDAAAALLWVLDHAREYGADPDRVVLAGESAGANIVTALTIVATQPREELFAKAIYERAPPIRAVVPIYGLLDLHHLHRFTGHPRLRPWLKRAIVGAGASYVGRPIRNRAPQCPLASPLRILAEPGGQGVRPLPPFFVAAGTADPLLDDSRRLCRAVEARGGICELAVYPGEIHGFNVMLWRPAARAKWRALERFLRKYAG